jgi:hypothetical protein
VAFVTPKTWSFGEVLTSTDMNLYVRDNTADLDARVAAIPTVEGIGPNVVMAQKTDTQTSSVSNNASVTVAGLTATITPSSATSKVLVMFEINHESSTTSAFSPVLKRGATAIGLGAAAGSRTLVTSGAGEGSSGIASLGQAVGIVLDSPNTTDPVSYTVDMRNRNNGSTTLYVNLSDDDTDSSRFVRSASRIIAIEVKA